MKLTNKNKQNIRMFLFLLVVGIAAWAYVSWGIEFSKRQKAKIEHRSN